MSRKAVLVLLAMLLFSTVAAARSEKSRCARVPASLPVIHPACVAMFDDGTIEDAIAPVAPRTQFAHNMAPVNVATKKQHQRKGRPPGRVMPLAPPVDPE